MINTSGNPQHQIYSSEISVKKSGVAVHDLPDDRNPRDVGYSGATLNFKLHFATNFSGVWWSRI